jgi:hypothetical protein
VVVAYADGKAVPMHDNIDIMEYLRAVWVDSELATAL